MIKQSIMKILRNYRLNNNNRLDLLMKIVIIKQIIWIFLNIWKLQFIELIIISLKNN